MMTHARKATRRASLDHTAGGVVARKMCSRTSLMEFGVGNFLGTKREGGPR